MEAIAPVSAGLPESLRPLFWDCDFATLDAVSQNDFIVGRVLASLCYFDDAEAEPMPRMLVPSDWDAIKEDIRRQVRAIA